MKTNCLAYARVTKTRLGTIRLLATFDTVAGRVTVRNSEFVSGDLCSSTASEEKKEAAIAAALALASAQMRTDNIVLL